MQYTDSTRCATSHSAFSRLHVNNRAKCLFLSLIFCHIGMHWTHTTTHSKAMNKKKKSILMWPIFSRYSCYFTSYSSQMSYLFTLKWHSFFFSFYFIQKKKEEKTKKKVIAVTQYDNALVVIIFGNCWWKKSQTRNEQVNKLMIILRTVFNELKQMSALHFCECVASNEKPRIKLFRSKEKLNTI